MKYLLFFVQILLAFIIYMFSGLLGLGNIEVSLLKIILMWSPFITGIISSLIYLYCESNKKNSKPWLLLSISMPFVWFLIVKFFIFN
jgi:hypothetical protein